MEQILTGLGLSGSAGLNAYLPLLILGGLEYAEVVELAAPYDTLGSPIVLAILTILLIIEMGADKVPALDSANDVINTGIRPAAGALLFAASTGNVNNADPDIMTAASILSGIIAAGSVHALKALIRPGVTVTTGGMGNMVVSVIEDVISLSISVMAIFLPLIILVFSTSFFIVLAWAMWDRKRTLHYFGKTPQELNFEY